MLKARKGQKRRRRMRSDPSVGGNDPFAGNPRRICEACRDTCDPYSLFVPLYKTYYLSYSSTYGCLYIFGWPSALYVLLRSSSLNVVATVCGGAALCRRGGGITYAAADGGVRQRSLMRAAPRHYGQRRRTGWPRYCTHRS